MYQRRDIFISKSPPPLLPPLPFHSLYLSSLTPLTPAPAPPRPRAGREMNGLANHAGYAATFPEYVEEPGYAAVSEQECPRKTAAVAMVCHCADEARWARAEARAAS